MERTLNLRLVGKRLPPLQNYSHGAWYLDPGGPQRTQILDYARKLMATARIEEPETEWYLETRGESGVWHKLEEPDAN